MANVNDTLRLLLGDEEDKDKRQSGTSSGRVPTGTGQSMTQMIDTVGRNQRQTISQQKNINSFLAKSREKLTYRDMLKGISLMDDHEAATTAYRDLRALRSDPSSQFYNAYANPTNKAAAALAEYGFDTSNINDDWFKENSWLSDYYKTTAYTNNISTPGKRASKEEKAAYQYYQLTLAEEDTKKAEQEWNKLSNFLYYWGSQTDRNYSDEKILDMVDWKEYPTLSRMQELAAKGTPMELNRGIDFSDDAMYGILWAAKNPDYRGSMDGAIANSALGYGNTYKVNDKIAAKLDPQSSEYSPYSVGCTMDKERAYFGVSAFDKDWVTKNRRLLTEGSEEDRKHYIAVAEAEETTLAAEQELADLYEKLDKKLGRTKNPEDAARMLDTLLESGDYPTLVKMDKSIDKGYYTNTQSTMGLTRAVNYRKADMLAYINGRIAEDNTQDEITYASTVANNAAGVKPQTDAGAGASAGSTVEFVQPKEPLPETIIEGTASLDDIQSYADSLLNNTEKPASGAFVPKEHLLASSGAMPSAGDRSTPGNVLEEQRRKAFDEKHGEGEYDRVMALARGETPSQTEQDTIPEEEPVNQMTEQETAVYQQQDQTLAEGIDMTDGMLTPVEQEYMDNAGSTLTDYTTDMLTGLMDRGTAVARNLAAASVPMVRQNHADAVLGSMQDIYDYERNTETLDILRSREAELLKNLEGKEYVGMERQDTETFQMERDGRRFEAILGWDNWNHTYTLRGIDELTPGGDRFGLSDPDDWAMLRDSDEITKAIQDATDKAAKIEEQNRDASYTEEDLETARQLRGIQLQIQDAEAYQEAHREDYEASRTQFDEDQKAYRELIRVHQTLGMDTDELEKSEAAIGYLTQFHDYEATLWNGYNPSQMYADAIASGEDKAAVLAAAKQGDEELKTELETAQAVKTYIEENGINVPAEYMTNLDRHIAKLERDHQDYEYFALSEKENFQETVRKGREMEYESRPQTQIMFGLFHNDRNDWDMDTYYAYQQNGVYDQTGQFDDHGLKGLTGGMNSLMTQDELDTYYYLLGSGDEKAATDYVNFLSDMSYGVLWTRQRQKTEAAAQGLTDQGLGGFLASNAMAVILNPVASIAAAGYYAYNAVTGNELNPDNGLLSFSHFRNATREESAQVIADEFGEGTWQQKLAQAGYEIVTNRADSAFNGVVFGAFGGGAGEGASFLRKALSETGSALPMGINASMDAAAEAKRKGASDAQAYGIAAVTALAETVTEGFSLENMQEARLIGEEVSSGTVKEFLKNWLTKAGVSEMIGESMNDIIENTADEMIMGELSEHADRVWNYRLEGMSREEAEAAARKDEVKGVLRTALISYLSPGLDIMQTGAGRYEYYRNLTQQHQQAGDNRSMLEIMRGEKKARKDLESAGAKLDGSESQDKLVSGYEILESAKNGSAATKTAAVSAMLNGVTEQRGTASKAIADAAAVRLGRIFGQDTIGRTQELVTGAAVGNVDSGRLTQAIQTAALSSNSQAAKVMQSKAFRDATPDVKAQMLADTVEADVKNPNVTNDIMKSVRENRINAEMKSQIAAGALSGARPAVAQARSASREARIAESQLDDRQEERKAAQDAITTANEAVQQNPQEGAAVMAEALNRLNSTTAVEQEYVQKAETAQRKEKEAKEDAARAVNEGMSQIRQEAEARVAEIEAQEAQAAQDAEVLAQQQAIEAQAAQEAQEASDNALDADVDAFIQDNYADATDEEKQHIRELFAKNRNTESTPDADRAKFLRQVGNKFGVNIVEADQTDLNANGYYDAKTNTITLNKKATVGDALYFVLGHELTHMTEQAGEYDRLASSILRVAFGEGTTYQGILRDMKAGRTNSPLARMVAARRAQYEQATGQSYGDDYYLQEIVADNLGLMLRGDPNNPGVQQDLINRLVADNPTTARKILDGIKSFLKRAVGMRGAWQTDMQNTVDLFTRALSNTQASREAQQAEQTGEAQPLTDRQGNETSAEVLRGNSVALDTEKFSLNSFNEAEQVKTIRAILDLKDEDGKPIYTFDQVKAYMKNARSLAAIIAADRERLDFRADPTKTMLKDNAEYVKTLDASTLCAKRQIYQGTFNAIQHALPNTPLTPADLIDLTNMMRDMGYETPCGICYVESRRRHLGEFADKWLKSYKGEYKPTLDQVTTSDGLEELRTSHPQTYQDFVDAMNAKGTMNPKVVQLRTDYRGEIKDMTKTQKQKVQDIGGLRVQSFSDFETPHLLDMVQAVLDMSAENLTSQAYTKVPNFAWVFGDTGIKINLSLIGKGTGVDANGNLLFDDVEGMPFEEAMRLRDRYSKNVGTILVGINDEHIKAAMADPRIDFIIPFHKSGWSKEELAKMPVLNGYSDYTNSQNEKRIKGRNKTNTGYDTVSAKESKIENFQPVGKNGYWDFTKTGKENAETYLKMCAEDKRLPKFSQFLVDNGDGSFSLQPDGSTDGYWKTLIDFKMYDNEGQGSPQMPVTPNVNMDQARRVLSEYKGGADTQPVAQPVVDRFVEEYKTQHPGRKYSLPNLADLDEQYEAAYNDYDDAAGEDLVRQAAEAAMPDSKIRDENGNLKVVYHQTNAVDENGEPFTVFDPERARTSMDIQGIYFAPEYDENHEYGDRTYPVFLDIKNPAIDPQGPDLSKTDDGARVMRDLIAQGYDGIINTEDGKPYEYVAFYPEQIKSAEAFTEDNDGNLIYPSQRFDSTNKDIRYSLPQDAPYMVAVERGETEQAQRMVEEAANSKGFDTREKAYHGTPMFGFTRFDMSNSQDEIFVAYNQKTAGTYTFGGDVRDIASTKDRQDVHEMDDATFLDAVKRYIRKVPESGGHVVDAVKYVKQNKIQQSAIQMEYFMESALDNASWNQASEGSRQMLLNATKNMFGYSDVKALMESLRTSGTPKEYMQTYLDYLKRYADENRFWKFNSATGNGATVETVLNYLLDFYGDFGDNEINADYGKFCARNIMETILGANKAKQGETLISLQGSGKNVAPYVKYYTRSSLEDRVDMERDIVGDSGIYQLYTRPGNQFVVDAQGALWREISVPEISDQPLKTRDIAEWARDHDYDSVRINNVLDSGGRSGNRSDGFGDIGIFFNPNDVKSADTVTRDSEGNVIPLSERFQDYNNDIRYQLPDDSVLERQIREYLAAGGSLNRPATPRPDRPQKQRQWGSARAEMSTTLHDQTLQYLKDNSLYTPDSNGEQVNRAFDWIQSHANDTDNTGYYGAVMEIDSPDFNYRSADGQAKMLVMMGMAAVKGDTATELRLADAYNRQGTELGQALQSRKIFQMMTPAGRQATLQREVNRINEDYKKQGKSTRVELSQETLEEAGKAKTPKEFDAVRKKAAKELASQMPVNWKDRLTAWRMLSMLGNPRTHVRNLLGNAIFMPVVGMKNKIGAVIEITSRQKERTKTLGLASKEARAFAKADAKEMESVLRGEEKYKEGSQVERERKPFGNSLLQKLVDANGNALEAEDWIFLQRHYRNALGSYMTANKLTAADMTGATLEKARAYAVQEAQKATYRDANKVIEGLNKWEASHPGVKFFGSAILPFKKTPANILKRGVEYSPVGFVNALTRGAKQVRSGVITPTQWIDKIASGLSGTSIMALGAMLSAMGAVSAGLDDDDDEFDKLQGKQEYAINLFGHSYTIDWAAPVCMPFFVGAALMDTYRNKGEMNIEGAISDMLKITEPVFNLSMLDGVNSLLDVSQYAEGNAITQIGEKILTNYATSFVPTAVGQVARTMDTTRRKSYVESGADLSTFRYALEGLENKLPYLSTTNIPYRDVWGNPDVSGQAEAAIENFFSPGYANQIKNDPVVTELERIYRETGDKTLIPKAAGKTIGKEKLNAEQYDQYVVSRGQTARGVLEDLMESPFWSISDDTTRSKMVADAWTYANQIGQNDVTGKALSSWVLESKTTGTVVQTIASRAADSNRSDYIAGYGQALAEALDNDNSEDYDTAMAALESAEATTSEIKTGVRNYFKPLYQAAYMSGDSGRMGDIEDALIASGLGFKAKDFNSWTPGNDEEDEINTSWLTTP